MRKPIKDHVPTLHMLLKVAIYFLFETENTGLVVIAVYAFLRLPKLSELWVNLELEKRWNLFPSTKSKTAWRLFVLKV